MLDVSRYNISAASPIAVFGAGSFGTAIAWMLSSAGRNVRQWCYLESEAAAINEQKRNPFFLSHCDLENVVAVSSVADAVSDCQSIIIATPSFAVAGIAEQLRGVISDETPILILSKGLDLKSGKLLMDAVGESVGCRGRIAVLSGPNHAEELSKGAFAGAVVASVDEETARYFQGLLSRDYFRLYLSADPIGVSICGAAKNVVAIACGMARGAKFGDNAVSLLMTCGLAEIARLVEACGGSRETCMGLAGVGDLNATCNSPHSRNGMYGEAFAREGISVSDYETKRRMVVEGAHAVSLLLDLADRKSVTLPVAKAVNDLLSGESTIGQTATALMTRDLGSETA